MSYFINSNQPHIFIHIPKTAGASILQVIKKNYNYEIIPNSRTMYSNYHSTLKDVEQFISPYKSNFFIFSVVRNPWSRAASWFYFRKEVLRKGLKAITANKNTTKVINNYNLILNEYETMNEGFNQWLKYYFKSTWDYTWFSLSEPQTSWLESSKYKVNKIIKFENLNKEFNRISIFKNKKISLYNQSPVKYNYIDIYNLQSINLIKKIYEVDIDTFKYTFN